jgi:hypothetical protein
VNLAADIRNVASITTGSKIDVPDKPGVYAFWWTGKRSELLGASTHIVLAGPGGREVDVHFADWWPTTLVYPCLYVGKSTNLRKRFGKHLMRGSNGRVHTIPKSGRKQKAATTSCQVRYGIEHIFPTERHPLAIINKKVGFSYVIYRPEQIAERFFKEDLLIGTWRPWFNVDSER